MSFLRCLGDLINQMMKGGEKNDAHLQGCISAQDAPVHLSGAPPPTKENFVFSVLAKNSNRWVFDSILSSFSAW